MVEDILFSQNPWKFRFVTLPQEISDKMKLHPWNFQKLFYTPWKFQGQYPRLVEIPDVFFLITPVISFSWPHFIFSIPLEIPCPLPPSTHLPSCMFFFSEITHSYSYTDNFFPQSFMQLIPHTAIWCEN